jgi:uncharacterized protein (TIGR02466 family)
MKLNLFSIPMYIGNIDAEKVKLKSKGFKKAFFSKTKCSIYSKNELDEDSSKYLLKIIYNLIRKEININTKLEIHLKNIWENIYEKKDYQERHIHPHSHFSFVIYKKINESKTVFINPAEKSILTFYEENFTNDTNFFKLHFQPECRQGQIVIFPSFLEHLVLQNNNSVTISGNIELIIENVNQDDKVQT